MAPYMASPGEEGEEGRVDPRIGTGSTLPSNTLIPRWTEGDSQDPVTTFDLVSVICHHGTPSSGHYTAYCLNNFTDTWYEFDDQYVTAVDDNQVAGCEAYVLFYRKTNDEVCERRYRCVQLIERSPRDLDTPFYISNQWINRFNTFAHPGPISNRDFLCSHGMIDPLKAPFVRDLCMSFNREIWDYLVATFGGGPPCNDLESVCTIPSCATTSQQANVLADRFLNSKVLSSFLQRVQSNDSLPRQMNEAASTTSLPETVLSSKVLSSKVLSSKVLSSKVLSSTVPQRTDSVPPLIVNGNGMREESNGMEENNYTSLIGTFGFDARRDLKRRRHEEKSVGSESLLLTRESPMNGASSLDSWFGEYKQTNDETKNGKKRNRTNDEMSGDVERVPLIATNGCSESAVEESDEETNQVS